MVPAAISYGSKATVPKSTSLSNGTIRIRRTEFVGSITNGAVTGYSLIGVSAQTPGYDLNPGCNLLFPWLSGISQFYERFKFNSIRFSVTPSQATATAGRLYLAVDYDYDDNPPGTKAQMMSNQTHVEGSVWSQLQMSCLPSELHPDSRMKYVSHATRQNFIEPRTAYCGYLVIAVDSPTANLQFDLEVTYDVELHLPVFDGEEPFDTVPAGDVVVPADLLDQPYEAGWVARPYASDLTVAPGLPLSVVSSGTADCPTLYYGGSTTYPVGAGPNVLDLKNVWNALHNLGMFLSIGATGLFASQLDTNTFPHLQLFSSQGAYLGREVYTSSPTKGQTVGKTQKGVALGNPLEVLVGLSVKALLAKYPAARYAVPVLIATVANAIGGGGTVRGGFKMM